MKTDSNNFLIEIKCSRKGRFCIKERDIQGLVPGDSGLGFLAVLITQDVQKGPHWIFVPSCKIMPRSYSADSLSRLKSENYPLFDQVNHLWSEVLLNDRLIDTLLSMKKMNFKSMEWWHGLALDSGNMPDNAIRKVKVCEALESMRKRLDEKHKGYGSRREGFLHQCILQFCLNLSGHQTISNITGVPDLRVIMDSH